MDAVCVISGNVSTARKEAAPIVVVLFRRAEARQAEAGNWQFVDYFVLEQPGRWAFGAGPGSYALAAFWGHGDVVYQPGETYGLLAADAPLTCGAGTRLTDLAIAIPDKVATPFPRSFDLSRLQHRSADGQLLATMGQLTATGEIASLSDARFSHLNAENGLWSPYDFLVAARAGVYFLAPYDPRRVPVLFVHGANGTPADFRYLIERLDKSRFQAWVYYYPSGVRLDGVSYHLEQTMSKLRLRHEFSRFAVVAHSMGGLVSRGFIQRHTEGAEAGSIPLFVSLSTPWGGHKRAQLAVDTSPVAVPVWNDMAPGSEYQRNLYSAPLPDATRHHLIFTFQRKSDSYGEADDQGVTVASQLLPQAQRGAFRLYGFDETHMGALRNAQVSLLVNQLLAETFP